MIIIRVKAQKQTSNDYITDHINYQHSSDQINLIINVIQECVPHSDQHIKMHCHTEMFITYLDQRGYDDDIKSTHMQPGKFILNPADYSRCIPGYPSAAGIQVRLYTSFTSVCGF